MELSAYELKRQRVIAKNAAAIAALAHSAVPLKEEAKPAASRAPQRRGISARRSARAADAPRRQSLRVRGKGPDGTQVALPDSWSVKDEERRAAHAAEAQHSQRLPEADVAFESVAFGKSAKRKRKGYASDDEDEEAERERRAEEEARRAQDGALLRDMKQGGLARGGTPSRLRAGLSLAAYTKLLGAWELADDDFAKVVPERAFSVAFYPSASRLLVLAGDKWGHLGFWDCDAPDEAENDGVQVYTPHCRPITAILFPEGAGSSVVTASYDGTVRRLDVGGGAFVQAYAEGSPGDAGITGAAARTPSELFVSTSAGDMCRFDLRSRGTSTWEVHDKKANTVSAHADGNVLATASLDATVRLWDVRKLTSQGRPKPLLTLPHGGSVNSAHFSDSGARLLTTCMDHSLGVYDGAHAAAKAPARSSIRHNCHTGRWLTKFQARFDPNRDDAFIVGSMDRPRRSVVYGVAPSGAISRVCRLQNEEVLGSVASLNAMHPSLNAAVGVNSSGRCYLFRKSD